MITVYEQRVNRHLSIVTLLLVLAIILVLVTTETSSAEASYHFSDYRGKAPLHIYSTTGAVPKGITPDTIKALYKLPKTGGAGTIAIIGAYNDSTIEKDLADFDAAFHLPDCTSKNGCFEKHLMYAGTKDSSGWALETSLYVEWAHAIAPNAKILLVEAQTPSGTNLMKAVDYAASKNDVVSVSMSWGGAEFPEETTLDSHFTSKYHAIFFASSGDNGWGASWPASSPNVVGVGGSSLSFTSKGQLVQESAWSGSGGGISAYEKAPAFQANYKIAKAAGMRAIPDVSYDADPKSGFPIVRKGVWRIVGGTSAGAPQWAAIASLGSGAENSSFYHDKNSAGHATYFRDITSGSNGTCGYICDARAHYDYVTGLGSPLTVNF